MTEGSSAFIVFMSFGTGGRDEDSESSVILTLVDVVLLDECSGKSGVGCEKDDLMSETTGFNVAYGKTVFD